MLSGSYTSCSSEEMAASYLVPINNTDGKVLCSSTNSVQLKYTEGVIKLLLYACLCLMCFTWSNGWINLPRAINVCWTRTNNQCVFPETNQGLSGEKWTGLKLKWFCTNSPNKQIGDSLLAISLCTNARIIFLSYAKLWNLKSFMLVEMFLERKRKQRKTLDELLQHRLHINWSNTEVGHWTPF